MVGEKVGQKVGQETHVGADVKRNLLYTVRECVDCGRNLPSAKFNRESYSPDTCFRCRIQGVSFGYTAGRESFHGDNLRGGTIASDNRETVKDLLSPRRDKMIV